MAYYADVLFVVNFSMDAALLWLLSYICRVPVKKVRLFVAAAIGALLYCLVLFTSAFRIFYNAAGSLLMVTAMLLWAFRPVGLRPYFRLLFFWHVLSFLLGGALTAVVNGFQGMNLWLLLGSTFACYSLFYFGRHLLSSHGPKRESYCRMIAEYAGTQVDMTLLLDTGNLLKTREEGLGIAVVKLSAVAKLLPAAWVTSLLIGEDIPLPTTHFEALGCEDGNLYLLRPDKVTLYVKDVPIHPKLMLGITKMPLSGETVDGLLNPEVFLE